MHILSRYDANLFVKELGNIGGKLNDITKTDKTHISICQRRKVDERNNG